eukprot:CAMPEP_0170546042 /NCGR_PEP_ID=MMETSP0211-20121228/4416_1 /TAXON_ID=311385 /ORGANISM="Pseudokeronopsis sp., Strain OXSARD2" /LENGTH=30 /DNA_ID= /DNA_START= /DNA_END= /DNA_ORIENTATION=
MNTAWSKAEEINDEKKRQKEKLEKRKEQPA